MPTPAALPRPRDAMPRSPADDAPLDRAAPSPSRSGRWRGARGQDGRASAIRVSTRTCRSRRAMTAEAAPPTRPPASSRDEIPPPPRRSRAPASRTLTARRRRNRRRAPERPLGRRRRAATPSSKRRAVPRSARPQAEAANARPSANSLIGRALARFQTAGEAEEPSRRKPEPGAKPAAPATSRRGRVAPDAECAATPVVARAADRRSMRRRRQRRRRKPSFLLRATAR